MVKMDVDDLKPGMTLAKSVYNMQGLLLLKAGIALSVRNIRVLKSWGITSVEVDGESPDNTDGVKDSTNFDIPDGIPEIVNRFKGTLDEPVMKEIMRVAVKIVQERVGT